MRRRLAALALLAASPALGAPRTEAEAAGAWTVTLAGSDRSCPLTLGLDDAPGTMAPGVAARALRFPAGCRRALPALTGAVGWTFAEGSVRLLAPDGRAVMVFAPTIGGALLSRGAGGQTFTIAPTPPGEVAAGAEVRAGPPARGAVAAWTPPAPTPVDPALAAPVAALAGTYALDRFVERDTCRLTLGFVPGAERQQARLGEGCRDGGFALFDPVAWRYEAGRLTLVARRGHEVTLVPLAGGRWRRDPETGTTLVLRRVE